MASWHFAYAAGKSLGDAHDLAGRLHLRARARESAPGKRPNGMTASFTQKRPELAVLGGQVHLGELLARHDARGDLRERHAGRLAHERHGAARARVDLEHVDVLVLHRELDVHEPAHAELAARARACARGCARSMSSPSENGGMRARRVARVDAGLLDVLHDAADVDRLAVADRVDVDLDRALEEPVEQHGVVRARSLTASAMYCSRYSSL